MNNKKVLYFYIIFVTNRQFIIRAMIHDSGDSDIDRTAKAPKIQIDIVPASPGQKALAKVRDHMAGLPKEVLPPWSPFPSRPVSPRNYPAHKMRETSDKQSQELRATIESINSIGQEIDRNRAEVAHLYHESERAHVASQNAQMLTEALPRTLIESEESRRRHAILSQSLARGRSITTAQDYIRESDILDKELGIGKYAKSLPSPNRGLKGRH